MSGQVHCGGLGVSCFVAICVCFLVACTATPVSSPAPQQPVVHAGVERTDVTTSSYSKFADPMYLAYDDESNVYVKAMIARLWVEQARWGGEGEEATARARVANQVLEEALEHVQKQMDPCAAGVVYALGRAEATKNQLEQRYLELGEAGEQGQKGPGEQADGQALGVGQMQLIDGQVHVLRDEIERLREVATGCSLPMFDPLPKCGPCNTQGGCEEAGDSGIGGSTK